MIPRLVILAFWLGLALGAARADSPTVGEKAACLPWVIRFCPSAIASRSLEAAIGCLQQHRPRIGTACRRALAAHGL